jgi:hypothetical protein
MPLYHQTRKTARSLVTVLDCVPVGHAGLCYTIKEWASNEANCPGFLHGRPSWRCLPQIVAIYNPLGNNECGRLQ